MSHLELDAHAKDKLLRLVGDRYDQETNEMTIVTDRCPTRKQNYEYAMFLLTALYYESWKVESWEKSKSEMDMEYYDWDKNISKINLELLVKQNNIDLSHQNVTNYKIIVCDLWNRGKKNENMFLRNVFTITNSIPGENNQSLNMYGTAVRQLLNLPVL